MSLCLLGPWTRAHAQVRDTLHRTDSIDVARAALDSGLIARLEGHTGSAKVLHAEPLYIDLMRDLGARKGEAEWNVGLGLTDRNNYDNIEALVEFEWAPIDRLGLEIEIPMSFYSAFPGATDLPPNRIESLKLGAQRTLHVSVRHSTSLAMGYIHQFALRQPSQLRLNDPVRGHVFNPFFVAAKRWGNNWHTLAYTGLQWRRLHGLGTDPVTFEWHSNVDYMVPGTRNFVGVEVNKYRQAGDFDMTVRPSMRLAVRDDLLMGFAVGVPVSRERDRLGMFLRLIYEPRAHR
ncbi:MAG: hypothetical protein MUD17_07035 [Gemmatimonadaceae bacterium]|nr:hypothetical protein [Gemmatimonadaceae bacterium]